MRVAVLGGLGMQGRAAVLDLTRSEGVDEVVCADVERQGFEKLSALAGPHRVRMQPCDASRKNELVAILSQVDVAIELLPLAFMRNAFEAAVEAGVPLVGTNYAKTLRDLHQAAVEANVGLMPECGLDPGIDLVLCGEAARRFDRLEVLNSYCGGIPERKAGDNPMSYKISWNWESVLRSQQRDSAFIVEGRRVEVPAEAQHDNARIHRIDFPGLGELEAIPNGDAVFYAELLGVRDTIRETGRYSLRWPGWCEFWRPLKTLGFLSDDPVPTLGVTPHEFLRHFLEPKLQYRDHEKDLVVMRNVFQGTENGRRKTLVTDLLLERDLDTALFAMSLGVGYPASIVAQMLGRGEIEAKGVLSPALHVPPETFKAELSRRGIAIREQVTWRD